MTFESPEGHKKNPKDRQSLGARLDSPLFIPHLRYPTFRPSRHSEHPQMSCIRWSRGRRTNFTQKKLCSHINVRLHNTAYSVDISSIQVRKTSNRTETMKEFSMYRSFSKILLSARSTAYSIAQGLSGRILSKFCLNSAVSFESRRSMYLYLILAQCRELAQNWVVKTIQLEGVLKNHSTSVASKTFWLRQTGFDVKLQISRTVMFGITTIIKCAVI